MPVHWAAIRQPKTHFDFKVAQLQVWQKMFLTTLMIRIWTLNYWISEERNKGNTCVGTREFCLVNMVKKSTVKRSQA